MLSGFESPAEASNIDASDLTQQPLRKKCLLHPDFEGTKVVTQINKRNKSFSWGARRKGEDNDELLELNIPIRLASTLFETTSLRIPLVEWHNNGFFGIFVVFQN